MVTDTSLDEQNNNHSKNPSPQLPIVVRPTATELVPRTLDNIVHTHGENRLSFGGGPERTLEGQNVWVDGHMEGTSAVKEDNRIGVVEGHKRSPEVKDDNRVGVVEGHKRSAEVKECSRIGVVEGHKRSLEVKEDNRVGVVGGHKRSPEVKEGSRIGVVEGHTRSPELKENNRLRKTSAHSQVPLDNRIVLRSNRTRDEEHSLDEGQASAKHRAKDEELPVAAGQVRIHEIEDEVADNHPLMGGGQVRIHEIEDNPGVGGNREVKEENRPLTGYQKKFQELNDDNRLLVGSQKRIQELSDEHRLLVGCNKKRNHEVHEENRPLISGSHKKIVIVPSNGVMKGVSTSGHDNVRGVRPSTRPDDGHRPHFINHPACRHGGVEGLMRSRQQLPMAMSSLRSLKSVMMEEGAGDHHSQMLATTATPHTAWRDSYFSDAVSVRSLASLGMGSTDGRRVTIRRVPTSPSELFNIVHPITPTEDGMSMASSSIFDPLDGHTNYRLPRRHQWANKVQFVLACVGYSVGLGNLWRFPYLCFKSGGGVFLVPYFIIFITCGIPLLYMELAIGQFTRRGPIGALGKLCPLFKGAGLASVVISFIMSTYYNVIIAYTLYYLFSAFRSNVPWTSCDNRWNTKSCWNPDTSLMNETRPNMSRTPSEEFYENKVLNMSDGIEHPGQIRWELAACLIFAWVLVYFSIWKSVKSSGKVLYFTATFPYLLILIFLVRALTLDGADLGLRYFFKPCWELLGDAKVWVNAAAQNFNSIGIAYGSVISFASYNRYHNSILSDALAVSCINAVTSVLVGICTFATIGNIAREQGRLIEDVISDGPGLVFVVYPQALSKMPAAQLWGGMFFFMLLCLGLNSQFAIVEVVVTSIQDGFPNWIKRKLLCHEMLVLVVVIVSCLFGLPNITQGGIYFFQLVDHYASSLSIMYLAFFEVIAIAWVYGANRLAKNVQEMTGKYPSIYFSFCWWFAAPVLIMSVWVFSLIDYERPTYDNGTYTYPVWAEALGWFIASLSLACIPVMAVAVIIRAEGDTLIEKFRNSYKSQLVECERCGEHRCLHSCTSKEDLREMSILLSQKMESQLEQINSP